MPPHGLRGVAHGPSWSDRRPQVERDPQAASSLALGSARDHAEVKCVSESFVQTLLEL